MLRSFIKSIIRHSEILYCKVLLLPDRLRPSNSRLIRKYVSSGELKKLHLGCGPNALPGWLNTDLHSSDEVAYLDLTETFPLKSDTFDYVFTEHVIEHIGYSQGIVMLREAYRVLRPGGKIRVVTPDFAFLIVLHSEDKSAICKAYISWANEQFLGGCAPPYAEMHVINNFVRDWGHRFIYDEKSLTAALQTAGFIHAKKCQINESDDPIFQGLENETRMPHGFLRLESLVLEAIKPA
jgi:predicted SAM-dependent methyltransferase